MLSRWLTRSLGISQGHPGLQAGIERRQEDYLAHAFKLGYRAPMTRAERARAPRRKLTRTRCGFEPDPPCHDVHELGTRENSSVNRLHPHALDGDQKGAPMPARQLLFPLPCERLLTASSPLTKPPTQHYCLTSGPRGYECAGDSERSLSRSTTA